MYVSRCLCQCARNHIIQWQTLIFVDEAGYMPFPVALEGMIQFGALSPTEECPTPLFIFDYIFNNRPEAHMNTETCIGQECNK